MSRPIKQGLDYFPMDVEIDDKIELIEAKHGISGFGILVKLFAKIYKEGYYLNWNEESLLIFSKRINVNINEVNAVINDSLCYHLFDKNLHKQYGILTSKGIQKRFLNAVDRRKEVVLDKRYIIADINGINVNINWINDNISTQSKVKYIYNIFYDTEIEKSKNDPNYIRTIKILFGENNLSIPLESVLKMPVQLNYDQFKKLWYLKEKFKISLTEILESMENWNDLKKRKTVYSTFLTFAKKRNPEISLTK